MSSTHYDTVQDIVGDWWQEDRSRQVEPGRLVWTVVPFPEVVRQGLVIVGRENAREHDSAIFEIEPFQRGRPPQGRPQLPVAALPPFQDEYHIALRGKYRPALVLGFGGEEIPKGLLEGAPGYQRKPCLIIAPYYGVDRDGRRAGYSPRFIRYVRLGKYRRFILDELPLPGPNQSVLRLDHVFSVGGAPTNFDITHFRLSPGALEVVHDWFQWMIEGEVPTNSLLELVLHDLAEIASVT